LPASLSTLSACSCIIAPLNNTQDIAYFCSFLDFDVEGKHYDRLRSRFLLKVALWVGKKKVGGVWENPSSGASNDSFELALKKSQKTSGFWEG